MAGIHWHADRQSFSCPFSPFVGPPRSRIMRVLMRAEEQHRAIAVKAVLGAVAVMHVPIDDQHPGDVVPLLSVPRRYRDVIEQAKPHGAIAFGMVPRRSNRTKDMIDRS